MEKKSPGRPQRYHPVELKEAWDEYRALEPHAHKTDFAKHMGLSVSRVRAILNDHPSELHRRSSAKAYQTRSTPDGQNSTETPRLISNLTVLWT